MSARRRLAEAIAAEWQAAGGAKGGEMSFADTPLTRLAGTAQQRVAPDPPPTVDAIARYGEHDLLCYRATAPETLARRQARDWQPWLDWAALTYDAPLRVTSGIAPIRQHRDTVAALRRAVAALDVEVLAALGIAVPALGSLVLGLALGGGQTGCRGGACAWRARRVVPGWAMGRGRGSRRPPAGGRRRHRARRPFHRVIERATGMNAKRLVIAGRVQGVGFRAWMAEQARVLGVAGWVRNRVDGTVEALIAGDVAAVEELARLCRRGPRMAEVSSIDEEMADPPDHPGFLLGPMA